MHLVPVLTQENGESRKHSEFVSEYEEKNSVMKEGQCSKVNGKYSVMDYIVL